MLPVSSIPAPRPSSPGTPHRISSAITDLSDFPCQTPSPRPSVRCSCMAQRVAWAMSSCAHGTVSLATSARKRLRAVLFWASTPSCNFRQLSHPAIERALARLQLCRFCPRSRWDNLECHKMRVCTRPRHRFSLCFKKSVDDYGLKLAVCASA